MPWARSGSKGASPNWKLSGCAKSARDWLARERERSAFEVAFTEQQRKLNIGGLTLNGRIDRMDRLADGSFALIDYKTASRVTANDWMGARPDDPQLPLYAVTAEENVTALAFAKVRAGDMKFSGFSAHEKVVPGVKTALDWPALRAGWQAELEKLARRIRRWPRGGGPEAGSCHLP